MGKRRRKTHTHTQTYIHIPKIKDVMSRMAALHMVVISYAEVRRSTYGGKTWVPELHGHARHTIIQHLPG